VFSSVLALDAQLYLFIVDELRTPFTNLMMPLFSTLGNFPSVWPFILAAPALRGGRRARTAALLGVSVLLLTWLCGELLLKPLFARPRPFEVFPDIELLVPAASGWSFPSSHAATSAAAAALLWRRHAYPAARATFTALAVLIICSRVYVGVHYPLDILGGAALGLFMAGLAFCTLPGLKSSRLRDV